MKAKIRRKIILDLCGGTGAFSLPYTKAGYEVLNITLPTYDVTAFCLKEELAALKPYGILSAPPCTMFSFARTRAKTPRDFRAGMNIVICCLNIIWECRYFPRYSYEGALKFWVLENPKCFLRQFLGMPCFTFEPWEFGDPYFKQTDLWGFFNVPKKKPIKMSRQQIIRCRSYAEQPDQSEILTDNELNMKTARRAVTPAGFANAFFKANK